MIRFGPSGNSSRFYAEGFKVSEQAPAWISAQGLNAYEYSMGRGIRIGAEKAMLIGEEAAKYDIALSVHAPYYINLAQTDSEKVQKSFEYILSSLEILNHMKGSRCVLHLGSCTGMERSVAIKNMRDNLLRLTELIYSQGLDGFYLCPETMGKFVQIGTVEEILEFCTLDKIFLPCFDFGHVNSYLQGGLNLDKYNEIMDKTFDALGAERANNIHIHFSKIQYGKSGEIRHLNFDDVVYGPDFAPLATVLKQRGMTPVVICESADEMADDAMTMKAMFQQA